jgi:hypothetical protein
MKRLLIAGLAVTAAFVATPATGPAAAAEGCYVIRSTADARNPQIATDRAKRHLQNYIARKLNKQTGITISPITVQCIRNACEASAIVCPAS